MQNFEKKNYKNYKLLGTDSFIKNNSVTVLVLLHHIVLVLLYNILCICNQISHCDMI